jgi:hypothetical protein
LAGGGLAAEVDGPKRSPTVNRTIAHTRASGGGNQGFGSGADPNPDPDPEGQNDPQK